jgi:nucleoside-diphosphate-sugar epimerase
VDSPRTSDAPLRLLIVGGNSRAARAFREQLAAIGGFDCTVLVRTAAPGLANETIVLGDDYFAPPASVLATDAVVNFAGIVTGDEATLKAVNVDGAAQLAAAAREAGARHYIHISSLSIYGFSPNIGTTTLEAPVTAYGRSKQAGDRRLTALATEYFTVTLLRVPILYSATARGKLHMLARVMTKIGIFPVPLAEQPRSVLHLDNLAHAITAVLQQPVQGVVFAADPQPFTLSLLAQAAMRHTGRRIHLARVPFTGALRRLNAGLHASLYGKSVIESAALLVPPTPYPRPTLDGLGDLFR